VVHNIFSTLLDTIFTSSHVLVLFISFYFYGASLIWTVPSPPLIPGDVRKVRENTIFLNWFDPGKWPPLPIRGRSTHSAGYSHFRATFLIRSSRWHQNPTPVPPRWRRTVGTSERQKKVKCWLWLLKLFCWLKFKDIFRPIHNFFSLEHSACVGLSLKSTAKAHIPWFSPIFCCTHAPFSHAWSPESMTTIPKIGESKVGTDRHRKRPPNTAPWILGSQVLTLGG